MIIIQSLIALFVGLGFGGLVLSGVFENVARRHGLIQDDDDGGQS